MATRTGTEILRELRAKRDLACFWGLARASGVAPEQRPAIEEQLAAKFGEWWDHHVAPLLDEVELRFPRPSRKAADAAVRE